MEQMLYHGTSTSTTVNANMAGNYYQRVIESNEPEKVEVEILVNNECGIIIKFSDEKPVELETYTEATVTVFKDKNGKIALLDIEYDPSAPTC